MYWYIHTSCPQGSFYLQSGVEGEHTVSPCLSPRTQLMLQAGLAARAGVSLCTYIIESTLSMYYQRVCQLSVNWGWDNSISLRSDILLVACARDLHHILSNYSTLALSLSTDPFCAGKTSFRPGTPIYASVLEIVGLAAHRPRRYFIQRASRSTEVNL